MGELLVSIAIVLLGASVIVGWNLKRSDTDIRPANDYLPDDDVLFLTEEA